MEITSKKDIQAWIATAERAIMQDENTPDEDRLSCKTLVELVLPTVRKVAEVLS